MRLATLFIRFDALPGISRPPWSRTTLGGWRGGALPQRYISQYPSPIVLIPGIVGIPVFGPTAQAARRVKKMADWWNAWKAPNNVALPSSITTPVVTATQALNLEVVGQLVLLVMYYCVHSGMSRIY